ncbi:2,3-bisphosphoglycerate-independent phosphoglycerate mutase [Paramaledivibacter caminithermalis]|uniref:2,3-bisphosphoglycerate-independent phosphoglycerate mutase n=1 Tax=Paramaledivibacter caminithermalis (strain DSM 15212 / CIP 107654 / DViRD3) TaxID=1121301 RepID=A0A1M6SFV5_PARC5|nr:2,3-bisphosphoglycerate-independent phosphoglycerate mutase [Paramaledivibacter caminithermalis]SHK43654.1 phosphoglycerate mutase [Paramaledivibacter caminithermalis DSM 15212]
MKKPTVLVILDGFGINDKTYGNAVKEANTPNLDSYFEKYPNVNIEASGLKVGLPEGQMGNSEVGHLNIGAGRIVYQDFTRITKSIEDGDFFENPVFIEAMDSAIKHNSALHLWGLLSDGGVHSHNTHLYALLKLAKSKGLSKIYIHCFLDGRDVPPSSAIEYINELEEKIKEIGVGKIATISGRYYAMDRDKRWDRVKLTYDAIVLGEGQKANSAIEAVEKSYAEDVVDEFIKPTVILENDSPVATVSENDSIIMFNFRPDRAREISRAFVDPDFHSFERVRGYFPVHYVCMTQYDATLPNVNLAYPPQTLVNTFGEYIANKGLKQLRIAETEKYAHVTFFFNGGIEKPNEGEDRVLIPSPKVATYDMKPEMSAYEVTDKLIEELNKDMYDVIIVNYANPDMVGHTGVMEAVVKAIETVDECIKKVVDAVIEKGGQLVITADHGNSDEMLDEEGNPITKHSKNPVPFMLINAAKEYDLVEGKLADIAPTLLQLMDLPKPEEMTGNSLLLEPAYESEGETA